MSNGFEALQAAEQLAKELAEDADLGEPMQDSGSDRPFQAHINNHLLPASPPRELETLNRQEASHELEKHKCLPSLTSLGPSGYIRLSPN